MAAITQYQPYGLPGKRRSFIAKAAAATVLLNIIGAVGASPVHIPDASESLLIQKDLEVQRNAFFGGTSNYSKLDSGGNISLAGTAQVITDMPFANAKFPIIDKASGNGIKVDTTAPTFGFADLLGDQFSKNTGATKPTLVAYNGAVDAWQFSNGDEAFLSYHIPHDYVPSTDIHLHVHWSQNNTGATGGTIDFKYFAIYSKGHNQASGSTFT
ncbi:hypothetical protein LCGC14_3080290, partial [marine sediment metagenome]